MANLNAPRGFKPVGTIHGGTVQQNAYTIASAYGYNIAQGDPVMETGTGSNIQLAVGTAGTPTPDGIGVFAGCNYTDANGKPVFSKYWPASTIATDIVAMVWDDPGTIFEVQADSCAANDVKALADFTAGTMDAVSKLSTAFLNVSGATGTTGKTFRIERIIDRPDNAAGAYAKVEVIYVEHARKGVISGAGGM